MRIIFYGHFTLMSFSCYGLVVYNEDLRAFRAGRVYIVLVVLAWGACPPDDCCLADLDLNGAVDIDDIVAVVLAFDL